MKTDFSKLAFAAELSELGLVAQVLRRQSEEFGETPPARQHLTIVNEAVGNARLRSSLDRANQRLRQSLLLILGRLVAGQLVRHPREVREIIGNSFPHSADQSRLRRKAWRSPI